MSSYNLIDEPWIPVVGLDGKRYELGIRDTLTRAQELAVIEDSSPLVTAALHRFLLAVLYRALRGPCDLDEAKKLYREGWPNDRIVEYLEQWRARFFLFDEVYPFGQIPEYTPKAWRAWTVLAAEHNADNAKVLFDHVIPGAAGSIQASAAVRWLLSVQTFVLSAGKSELSHTGTAPSATSLMVLPMGIDLRDTLSFSLVPQIRPVVDGDSAMWEREPENVQQLHQGPQRGAYGFADLFTWRSRAIRFAATGPRCVEKVAFASGVGYRDAQLPDPMVPFRVDKKFGKLPAQVSERGVWRDFDSLLPGEPGLTPLVIEHAAALSHGHESRRARTVLAIGQANNQAKIECWRMERFILPKLVAGDPCVRHDIHDFLQRAADVASTLNRACRAYARRLLSRGERAVEKKDVTAFLRQMPSLSLYWTALEAEFHSVLGSYARGREPDAIHRDWLVSVRNTLSEAWDLLRGGITGSDAWGLRAFVRAEHIVAAKLSQIGREIESLEEE